MFKITPIMKKAVGLAETASEKPVKEVAKEATEVAKTVAQPPMTGLGTDLVQSSKKAYVKPEIRVIKMEDEHHILVDSYTPRTPIPGDPPYTEPDLSESFIPSGLESKSSS